MPDVSVIIPVYNAEKYLRECLDSIKKQDCDFEAIIIDDGSQDSSPSICDEYAVSDSRFKVFHCENSGPANARNLGLSKAKGLWITFVDADDVIETGYLNICISKKYIDCDVIFAQSVYINQSGNCISPVLKSQVNDDYIINTTERLKKLRCQVFNHKLDYPYRKISYTWGKFYNTRIISDNDITFPSNISYCEDTIFLSNYLKYADNAVIITSCTSPKYLYRFNDSSITSQLNLEVLEKKRLAFDYIVTTELDDITSDAVMYFLLDQFYACIALMRKCGLSKLELANNIYGLYCWNTFRRLSKYSFLKGSQIGFIQFFLFKSRLAYLLSL